MVDNIPNGIFSVPQSRYKTKTLIFLALNLLLITSYLKLCPIMPSKRLKRLEKANAPSSTLAFQSLKISTTGPRPPALATNFKHTESGLCSMFMIQLEPKQQVWRYDVQIDLCSLNNADGKNLKRSLTKGSGDGQQALNRKLCFDLLNRVCTKTVNFGMTGNGSFVYDNKASLYTSQPIKIEKQQIAVEMEEVDPFTQTIVINPNESGHLLNLGEPLSAQDEAIPIRTFLEMATSQEAVNSKVFSAIGPGKLYLTDAKQIESMNNGIELRPGLKKGVRIVSNNGKPCPAVVLDSKTSPFFKSQNLLQTIKEVNGGRIPASEAEWTHVLFVVQDLRVEPIYAPKQSFEIGSFTEKAVNKIRVPTSDNSMLFVHTYFEKSRGISLDYPQLPGVISNKPAQAGRTAATYPIELLKVMPDQRVPLEKMNKNLSERLLERNSVHPNDRLANVMQRAEQLNIFSPSNKILSSFGVKVVKDSNEVVIGVRHPPKIQFRDSFTKTPDSVTTRWNDFNARYISTKQISEWLFYYPKNHEKNICDFRAKFSETAKAKGMRFVMEKRPYMVPYTDDLLDFKSFFAQCVTRKIEFVLFIDSEKNDTHADLKYYEARYKILTQHITTEIVENIVKKGHKQTMENIMHKVNCKNFGLNYMPIIEPLANEYALESGEVLVIGLDVSHPPPAKKADRRMLYMADYQNMDSLEPSVVGICANMAAHPHAFVGDYFYQQSRKESIDVSQLKSVSNGLWRS
uniref:PAZ domain-containing protein n=1 Tax=Ditylenchus dipsaci TaxID=166011 RepID=A0A915DI93_9BILA